MARRILLRSGGPNGIDTRTAAVGTPAEESGDVIKQRAHYVMKAFHSMIDIHGRSLHNNHNCDTMPLRRSSPAPSICGRLVGHSVPLRPLERLTAGMH